VQFVPVLILLPIDRPGAIYTSGKFANWLLVRGVLSLNDSPTLHRSTLATWIPAGLAAYAFAGGLVTLAGWTFDLRRLTDWEGNGISQMPNNALGIVAGGAALILWSRGRHLLSAVLAAFAGLIGAATLFEYISGIDLGIDQLLVHRDWGQRGTVVPGRMGPPGSTSLTIIGASIILTNFRRTRRFAPAGGLLTIGIALLSLTGYLFGAGRLYTIPKLTTIAFQTSTMLLALGVALVASVPDRQPMKLLGSSAAALLVRRALPGIVLLPLILGWLSVRGEEAGLFDNAFGTAVLVLLLIALLTALLWWSAAAVRVHETAIRATRDQLAGVLGSITDAFMTVGSDWRLMFVNEEAQRRFGMTHAALSGRDIWDLLPDAVNNEAYRQLHRAMSERVSVEYEVFYPPWHLWFAEKAYPTAEGGLAIYSCDITARKHFEDRLRESEERMQLAMTIADAATWDLDLRTNTNHWSDSHFTLLGYEPTPDRVAGREMWQNAILPEDLPVVSAEWERAERERDLFRSEHRLRRADNAQTLWASAAGRFFYDSAGRAVRFVGVFYDVTRRKEAEEGLRSADRIKDEFLATLSHELRTPLTAIVGWSQMLLNGDVEKCEQGTAFEAIRSSAKAQTQLIDDVLDISRITSGKMRLEREPADLAAIVDAAAATVRPAAEAKRISLELTLDRTLSLQFIDPARIQQVIWNLLSNAIKFSPPASAVEVTLRAEDSFAVVDVEDHGQGIAPEFLPHVFDRFRQADSSATRAHSGLGLGLALAKDLVELHGGTIEAESEEGRGSRFTVRLPIIPADDGHETRATAARSGGDLSLTGLRVLYVDDREDARVLIARMLVRHGAEVLQADSVEDALLVLRAGRPHVVVTDIAMPVRDGYDLLVTIRADRDWSHVPVVALTAEGRLDDDVRAAAAGFCGFLRKPIEPDELAVVVAQAVAGGRLREP